MRFSRIDIDGFGALRGLDIRFSPGINLVVGPNEAGKSTLQEAILTGLYGLHANGHGRRTAIERAERWRPWQDGPFGLVLELVMDDGTRLGIERDLEAETLRVFDLDSRHDVTARFNSSSPDDVGRLLLGVGREIYANTACVSRSEVMRLEDPGSIKEAISALADSARVDRSSQRVLDQLRQERAERIGRPAARSGPLRELEARLVEMERQLKLAEQARASIEELALKRESVMQLTEGELTAVRALDAAVAFARLDDARRRLARVEDLDGRMQAEGREREIHSRYANFPVQASAEVHRLRSHLRATIEAQQEFERRNAELVAEIHRLEIERDRLESDVIGHEQRARGIDADALKQEAVVRELVSALSFADAQAPEVHLRAQTCAEEVRQLADRHPGLIGPHADWAQRRVEFQRRLAEWRERNRVALDGRKRAGEQLPPRLEQLKNDIARFREVPDVIKAGQGHEEAMRREEAMAERARARQRTFLGAMVGGALLTVMAFLTAFLTLQAQMNPWVDGLAFFLLGMGVLAIATGIWVRAGARREIDRHLRAKDEARMKRREVLSPWGVRNSGELQQMLVEHLQKVRNDATRLELDRQASDLEARAQEAGSNLREMVGAWGLPQPAPTEDSFEECSRLLDALAQDNAQWLAAAERSQEASRAEATLEERREVLRQQLHSLLDRLGFDRREALGAGRDFMAACEAVRSAQQVRTRIDQLDAQLGQLRLPGERATYESKKAAEYIRQLEAIYVPAGIVETDPEKAGAAWDAGVEHAQAYAASSARISELRHQRLALVGEQDSDTIRMAVGLLERQAHAAAVGLDPALLQPYLQSPLDELERRRDQHRSAKEHAQEERARADELLNDRLRQVGDIATLEEEIAALRRRIGELERLGEAYDLAIETLEASTRAVRRSVIPQLKAQLQDELAPITNGRYREVQVGDDLSLQVKPQDQRTFKSVDSLSLGTRSLIYLLQRLAIARIIGGNSEPLPLMLDEALVHTDRRRMKAALEELARLGEDHQIILFSKDEALAERGEKAGDWNIVRLPGPAAADTDAPRQTAVTTHL